MFCFLANFHTMTLDVKMFDDFKNYTWWQVAKLMI